MCKGPHHNSTIQHISMSAGFSDYQHYCTNAEALWRIVAGATMTSHPSRRLLRRVMIGGGSVFGASFLASGPKNEQIVTLVCLAVIRHASATAANVLPGSLSYRGFVPGSRRTVCERCRCSPTIVILLTETDFDLRNHNKHYSTSPTTFYRRRHKQHLRVSLA